MAISEDTRTSNGDDTDDIIRYGGSPTHRHTDLSNPEEGSETRNGENLPQGQGIPEQQPTQSQTVNQDGRGGIQEETPTPTPEPNESNPNVIPVTTSTFGPSNNITPTPSSTETDSTAGIANTGNGGSTGMSGNKKVAIAVPVAIGGAAVIAGIILLVLYIQRRKQHKQQQGRASLLPPANIRVDMGQAPAAATMVIPSSQAQAQAQTQAQAQPRNIDLSPPFDGSLPDDPSPPYQPSTNTGSSRDIDANHAPAIGVALSPEPQAPPSPSPSPPPAVTGVAARNIQSQDIDSQNRAQSPFDDPIPDTFSDISRVSGRRRDGLGSIRSAVSSIDDEHEGRDHGHGRGRMSID